MKKIISLITMVTLLLAMVIPNQMAFAQKQPCLNVSNVEGECGDEVEVTVSIKDSLGFGGMAYDIKYDNNVLRLVSYSLGLGKNICTDSGVDTYDDKVNFQYAGTSNIEGDGVLVTLTFKIIGTEAGDSIITVVPEEGTMFYYENRTEVDFSLDNATGKVVLKERVIPVTGIEMDESISVKTGESKILNWSVMPVEATNKSVLFKSDNTAIALVNENTGEVTGVKKGTAIITATTVEGNYMAECLVVVACAHANKILVEEKNSDCKNAGWDAYKKCNDCGQLFRTDGTTEIADIPFRELSNNHNYTIKTVSEETLKKAGNCRDKAVYWYSCSVCGRVEKNDAHTFDGVKDTENHVGGCHIDGALKPDHKNQIAGTTGTTVCDGCGAILLPASPIAPGEHIPADVYVTNENYHWKECSVDGCGVLIVGSKATHISNKKENKATCLKAAVCDVCGCSYGSTIAHEFGAAWCVDETGHWYACKTPGCNEIHQFEEHIPDHHGNATEEYAIKCSVCEYVIQAQLEHMDADHDGKCDNCGYKMTESDDSFNSDITPAGDETIAWQWSVLLLIAGLGMVMIGSFVRKTK